MSTVFVQALETVFLRVGVFQPFQTLQGWNVQCPFVPPVDVGTSMDI